MAVSEVDDQLNFGHLQNRQVGRLLALDDARRVDACRVGLINHASAVAHQAAGNGVLTE